MEKETPKDFEGDPDCGGPLPRMKQLRLEHRPRVAVKELAAMSGGLVTVAQMTQIFGNRRIRHIPRFEVIWGLSNALDVPPQVIFEALKLDLGFDFSKGPPRHPSGDESA
jgi:hypothetical protein